MLITRVMRYAFACKLETQCYDYAEVLRMSNRHNEHELCWKEWDIYNRIVNTIHDHKVKMVYWFIHSAKYLALCEMMWDVLREISMTYEEANRKTG